MLNSRLRVVLFVRPIRCREVLEYSQFTHGNWPSAAILSL